MYFTTKALCGFLGASFFAAAGWTVSESADATAAPAEPVQMEAAAHLEPLDLANAETEPFTVDFDPLDPANYEPTFDYEAFNAAHASTPDAPRVDVAGYEVEEAPAVEAPASPSSTAPLADVAPAPETAAAPTPDAVESEPAPAAPAAVEADPAPEAEPATVTPRPAGAAYTDDELEEIREVEPNHPRIERNGIGNGEATLLHAGPNRGMDWTAWDRDGNGSPDVTVYAVDNCAVEAHDVKGSSDDNVNPAARTGLTGCQSPAAVANSLGYTK